MAYNPAEIELGGIVFEPFISETEVRERVRQMADELSAKYVPEELVLLSVLKGSFIFTADFYRDFPVDVPISFIRASSYEGMHSTGEVSFSGLDEISVRGRSVLILEDIVDSGNTLAALTPQLMDRGARDVHICTLLFKPTELKRELPVITAGFEIPSVFVVGYGRDNNELGRNLSGIYRRKTGL